MLRIRLESKTCHNCGNHSNLEHCRTCNALICPSCRWGTGDLDDGFHCTEHWKDSKAPEIPAWRHRPSRSSHDWPITLAVVALCLAYLAIYLWQ